MKANARFLILLLVVIAAAVSAAVLRGVNGEEAIPAARLAAPPIDPGGFARAEGPQEIRFPEDNGPHPEYLTEWWYYTGNLDSEDGKHYGFQLTFFRRALAPPAFLPGPRDSAWAADQVYLAHFSFTDVEGESFYAFERFSRGAAGLAGAQADPYRVWLENWFVEQTPDGRYLLSAESGPVAIRLTLVDSKGPILHGIQGYSQKGPEPGNASYYISQTRLESEGAIRIEDEEIAVRGLSWMDHEYSTSALGAGQVGWDWFSLQLDDGSELMLFQLRNEDGTPAEFSSGTLIAADGSTRHVARDEFSLRVEESWTSPDSGAVYPSVWTIEIPGEGLRLRVEPYLAAQELRVSFVYWEGAVQAAGSRNGAPLSGSGYLEMTGYAHSMQGEF